MKKIGWILFFIFFTQNIALALTEPKKITPPKKTYYDTKTYRYDPNWKNKEIYLETNLDEDEDKEIIIAFMGSFKREKEKKDEDPEPFTHKKKEIAIIKHQAFYQIYDKGSDGHYQQVKMLTGMDQLGRIELVKLDGHHPTAIAVYSPGGRDYLDLSIYLWKEGGYRLIFNYGGPQNIYIDTLNRPISVICEKENQSDKNVISRWDETTSSFK